jgi:LacI family gluconate utilization system Gnt-I transcriptional repressor
MASPITLADVARHAGVSLITASRAIRTPAKVAGPTLRRIEAAVADLGYVPNLIAGALASARTRTVALLVPTIASSIFAGTINGLSDALEAEGFGIVLAQSGYDSAREVRALSALLGRRPDALVMVGQPASDAAARLLQRAASEGVLVIETWELPASPIGAAVGFDNVAVGAAVARHFAGSGRRRLAFVGGSDARAAARFQGYARGARAARLAAPVRITTVAPAAMDDAAAAARDPRLASADAIFAANDVHAMGLLGALGACVPQQVALVGLGDLEITRHARLKLSTVRIDGAAIGAHAGRLVLLGAKAAGQAVDVGFELVVRDSG